jgi:hypothetical protein
MPDDRIGFTANEQNALALLCEMMSRAAYESRNGDNFDETAIIDSVARIADSFVRVRWDELYDKFHRQGKNA